MTPVKTMVDLALSQAGDPYRVGTTGTFDDPNPPRFDCSGLVHWASGRAHRITGDGFAGLTAGSWLQYRYCKARGTTMDVEHAIHTFGCLLFRFSSNPLVGGRPNDAHVVISLGNGATIEARGRAYGVGSFPAGRRGFNYAAYVPDFDYLDAHHFVRAIDAPIPTPEVNLQEILILDRPFDAGPNKGEHPILLTDGLPHPLSASKLTMEDFQLLEHDIPVVRVPMDWAKRLHVLERADGR